MIGGGEVHTRGEVSSLKANNNDSLVGEIGLSDDDNDNVDDDW